MFSKVQMDQPGPTVPVEMIRSFHESMFAMGAERFINSHMIYDLGPDDDLFDLQSIYLGFVIDDYGTCVDLTIITQPFNRDGQKEIHFKGEM